LQADALVLSIRDLFLAVHKINKMNKAAAAAKRESMEGDNIYDVVPYDTASLSASSKSESIQVGGLLLASDTISA
jgi:hypothetical protein